MKKAHRTSTSAVGLAFGLLLSCTWLPAAAQASDKQTEDVSSHLEIYKEFDGRCQGLRRGDARMIRNNHPDKSIKFRMVRILSGQRQPSIIQDTIAPGEDNGQKLGCEKLDDREQNWRIIRAEFVAE